MLIFFNVID